MDISLIEVVCGFFTVLYQAEDHIARLGYHRWEYYVNAAMVEVTRCEVTGWKYEPNGIEGALEWM